MDTHSPQVTPAPPAPKVLVVDDEPTVRENLAEALTPYCSDVRSTDGLHGVLQAADSDRFDVLVADVCMPGASGLDLLALAQQLNWDCAVILMTGHAELEHVVAGVRLHAADFLLKPFGIDTLCRSVRKSYDKLLLARQHRSEREVLSAGLRERTEQLEFTQHLLSDSYRSALETLVATLEAREPQTYAHSFRVRAYALHLAGAMGYVSSELPRLAHAALLHDLGKVAVSDAVLLKPGPLNSQEFEILKSHSAIGERIVNRIGFLAGAGKIIRHHHERWDGRGYPDGISGDDIPFGSRLFAVADTLDAMTSNRCYRRALTIEDARKEIHRCGGMQFDPAIANVFLQTSSDLWIELRRQADHDAEAAIIPEVSLAKILPGVGAPAESYLSVGLP